MQNMPVTGGAFTGPVYGYKETPDHDLELATKKYVDDNAGGGGGGGATNLSFTGSSTDGIVVSSTGTDATIPLGNGTTSGLSLNNFTTAEKNKLAAITGTNTGDQTSIVGITGTKAQFNTAVTDGDFMYVGDAPTAHTHTTSDITNFNEAVEDVIGTKIVAGTNVSVSYNDTLGETTISSTGSGSTEVYIQATEPTVTNNALWVQTFPNGNFSFWYITP